MPKDKPKSNKLIACKHAAKLMEMLLELGYRHADVTHYHITGFFLNALKEWSKESKKRKRKCQSLK